ncbi:unnamed protein product [Pedinophyceae sp. YPF-701]|nr:unnamed protein product [Pedinophyceae sp. YPF-701]
MQRSGPEALRAGLRCHRGFNASRAATWEAAAVHTSCAAAAAEGSVATGSPQRQPSAAPQGAWSAMKVQQGQEDAERFNRDRKRFKRVRAAFLREWRGEHGKAQAWKRRVLEEDDHARHGMSRLLRRASIKAWTDSELRASLRRQEALRKQQAALQKRAVGAIRRLVTETELELAKNDAHEAVLEASRDWITMDNIEQRIKDALANPVPLAEGASEPVWIRVARRKGLIED